jgi:hypothetical protein
MINEEGYQKRRSTEASEEKFWIAGELIWMWEREREE